jgi:hypothetical protein
LLTAVTGASAPAPLRASGTASGAGWPCTGCGVVVALDLTVCPSCGAAFLGRLAGDSGRHRSSSRTDPISRLPRPARLVAGLVLGALLAVLVPVLLALVG